MRNNILPPTKNESRIIKFMIFLGVFSIVNFLFYFFQPEHRANTFLFMLLSITILYSVTKKLYMWYNYLNISIPKKKERTSEFKVDILTTYYPGEPYEMITTTLEAIKKITYPHTTYLCDEANDPFLKEFCKEKGIRHVTRNNRKNAKAGNINNALEKVATGDICVILDPDHIPHPDFLDPILPYFENPEIGFVQIVQSYYNTRETLVAQGAAEQTFQFYGPIMMTLNSYGSVNAIGANCVFRRAALDSIGGHAPGLCEDMHTAMLLYSKGWKAVYLPKVLAKGLAPSNLTSFYKQQLKWARGSFDLWLKVYPKIFTTLTARQKIHFGILPMHYLSGLITLIVFLIPVLSLILSTTPWEGNIIDFALVLLPVIASSILIRTYIQKWVIEKKERGFHIIGGLLHINSWWVYLLGLFYTIIDRKVPYIPTPKEDNWTINFKIIIPNAIVALVSIFAIIYGLKQDFTPFSIIMAGFALFNTLIMAFGIYFAIKVTNQNKILRTFLHDKIIGFLGNLKQSFYRTANVTFNVTRFLALPFLLIILVTSMSFKQQNDVSKWEEVEPTNFTKIANDYFGIFHPSDESGLSDIEKIDALAVADNIDFDIISFYLAWNDESITDFPHKLTKSIYKRDAIPMITWEPWASGLSANDSIAELQNEQKIFKHILNGKFDNYIRNFANILKSYDKPVFLRFAHEFNNPQYPWSGIGQNTPEEFKAAWKYVYTIIKAQDAHQVMMVWNPWQSKSMSQYYPGDDYVDWIGITLLNYGPLNQDGQYHPFEDLYQGFHDKLFWFTRKPVMLAEFGSVRTGNRQNEWLKDAMNSINRDFEEIKAIVMFNSEFDQNIPSNDWFEEEYLDWTTDSLKAIKHSFKTTSTKKQQPVKDVKNKPQKHLSVNRHKIKGVRYKKGVDWIDNYYSLTKNSLVKDFNLMKEMGINTIQLTGGNIYDYNILSQARNAHLKVIYQFKIDNSADFTNDSEELKDLKDEIINKAEKLRDYDNVIGYSFNYDLEKYFVKPLLFSQRTAYLRWLQSVTNEIKSIDPEKSLILDLELDTETKQNIKDVQTNLPIDSYGLVVKEMRKLDEILDFAKDENISVFISSLKPKLLIENEMKFIQSNVILENWQDERSSSRLTFDGLVDFEGRKKRIARRIENTWAEKNHQSENSSSAGILKPSEPLFPGTSYTYNALLYDENKWFAPTENDKGFQFEWHLIKNDLFGNHLAIKKLGTSPELNLKIPQNYKQYELMLTAYDQEKEIVISSKSKLHTYIED